MTEQPFKLAIIGGGQLGYMLCEAARNIGVSTVVVTVDEDAPALQIADHVISEPLTTPGLAARIAAVADAVTFEFEAVPGELLQGLAEQQALGNVRVAPDPAVMQLLQNKAGQKDWLVKHGIPTLPYHVVDRLNGDHESLTQRFGLPIVQKAQVGGYDGYGVQKISTPDDINKLWDVPSIIEPAIVPAAELSVVLARAANGSTEAYAPVRVDADPTKHVLNRLIAPADISADISRRAVELGTRLVAALGGVGVFAVEMFLTSTDELLVNEVSPRVHNTGHHTLEAAVTSQFEQHVRAVAGIPLGSPVTLRPAVMQNLLYTDRLAPLMSKPAGRMTTPDPAVTVYWYGKREARQQRKMGHIVGCDMDPDESDARIETALKELILNSKGIAA